MFCKKCRQIIPTGSKFCMYCGENQNDSSTKRNKKHRGHGQGSVTVNKNCTKTPYYARVSIGGKRISVGYYSTIKEANQAIAEYLANNTVEVSPRVDWTLQQFYDTWSERIFPTITKSGINAHKASWKYMDDIYNHKMRDLKTSNYQACIDKAVANGKSRAVCEKIRNLTSLLCQEAMRDDVIDKNYARLLELPKSDKKEKDIFSPQEIELLVSHDQDIEAKILLILIYTGLRIGEFLSLRPCDVDTENWVLVGGSKTEAGRNRTVPILPNIRQYFTYLINETSSSEEKLVNMRYEYYRDKYFFEYLIKLGILTKSEVDVGGKPRLTPHCARHTFASLARKSGMDKDILTRIIGHTDYATTDENYVTIDSEMLNEEMNKIISK